MDTYLVRYDTPNDYMRLDAFSKATAAQASLIAWVISTAFEGTTFEVVIYAPKPGTVQSRIGVVVLAVGGLFAFAESDIGKAFSQGMFGAGPAELARRFGERLRGSMGGEDYRAPTDIELHALRDLVEEITIGGTQMILSCEESMLEELIRKREVGREISDGYSGFYEACLLDQEVMHVDFPDASLPPVSRGKFSYRAALRDRVKDNDDDRRFIEISTLRLTSPNWEIGD